MDDEQDVRYVKGSQKTPPTKADHKHEYIRPFAMLRLRRFDGTVTEEKYKSYLRASCVECGYVRRTWNHDALEVEVSPEEYRRLRKKEES
jgi:hypothetical protein